MFFLPCVNTFSYLNFPVQTYQKKNKPASHIIFFPQGHYTWKAGTNVQNKQNLPFLLHIMVLVYKVPKVLFLFYLGTRFHGTLGERVMKL